MNVKEFLDKNNLVVSKITLTRVGNEELDTPVVLYNENDESNVKIIQDDNGCTKVKVP